jgi:mRNA interferase HigB
LKNIISLENLIQFYQEHPNAKSSLEIWMSITKHANWQKPSDVLEQFPDADPVKNS